MHTREAYDHYLPKEKYPFNTINFKNLDPMCHKCNSSNKARQNPIMKPCSTRRKAFYPYGNKALDIEILLEMNTKDIANIKEGDIAVTLSSANFPEETKTWKEIFYIEERYKQKCTNKAHGKYWYTQILDEMQDCSAKEVLRKKIKQMKASPFADNNFLRKPFLLACEKKGLFPE